VRQSTAIGLAIVLAFIGLNLIKSFLSAAGTVGELAGGAFLIALAVWMLFAALRRGIIR
jgi:putative Mn2+ efflux pump MntP